MNYPSGMLHKMMMALLLMMVAGCHQPPSVVPMLRLSVQAVQDEAAYLQAEAAPQAARMQSQRELLRDAFAADLQAKQNAGTLEPQWVQQATDLYVMAREQLVYHEQREQAAREKRIDNLDAASQLQTRAIQLLEQHDAMWELIWEPARELKQHLRRE